MRLPETPNPIDVRRSHSATVAMAAAAVVCAATTVATFLMLVLLATNALR